MKREICIGNKHIGEDWPCFIIAEMSGNHNMDFNRAAEMIREAKQAGADAVKLQTYTADTITLNSSKPYFYTDEDSLWSHMTLYELYQKAYTPWDWQPKLKEIADREGILLFSSPFDLSAVDFLEKMDVPAYKIASYEINDIPLIKKAAQTGKPLIISTGIAYMEDIDLALRTCQEAGNDKVALLKCTSEYPAVYEEMNLRMISGLKDVFGCPVGLSDHSMGDETDIAAVALGADVIEKHFTLKRSDGGVDAEFSMEITELADMIQRIRHTEAALGKSAYGITDKQAEGRRVSRSLFAAADIKKGEVFSEQNIRSVRPGNGLHTRYYEQILGKKAKTDISYAEPLKMEYIDW